MRGDRLSDPKVIDRAVDLGRILSSKDRETMPVYFARFLDSYHA